MRGRPRNADEAIDFTVRLLRLIGSPGYPTNEADVGAKAQRSIRRSNYPLGGARQLWR